MESMLKYVKKTAFEVSMKVVVKLEDITPDEIEALFKLELLGLPVDVSFTYHQQEEQKAEKTDHEKLLHSLFASMNEYCKFHKADIDRERMKILERNNVSSRIDMTDEQLQKEIESYRA